MGLLAIIVVLYVIWLMFGSPEKEQDDSSSLNVLSSQEKRLELEKRLERLNSKNEANRQAEVNRQAAARRQAEASRQAEVNRQAAARRQAETKSFRPTPAKSSNKGIVFNTSSSDNSRKTTLAQTLDLSGLNDAFTGAALDRSLGLYQCQACKVYYHSESFAILKEANNSQCVACSSTKIIDILGSTDRSRGNNYTPDVVTLNNYKKHVGSVVTFEGYVCKVNESRRGNDFAVMFENESWAKGFKLVFFRGAAVRVGGASYIKSLSNKKIKVRGLLIKHPKFGYEIIISQKSMILSVS